MIEDLSICEIEILNIIHKVNSGLPVGIQTINNRLSDKCFDKIISQSKKTLSETLNILINTGFLTNSGDKFGFYLTKKGKKKINIV
ncbi:MAG: hypothetical protein ACK4YV_03445 [Emticicia sp.]